MPKLLFIVVYNCRFSEKWQKYFFAVLSTSLYLFCFVQIQLFTFLLLVWNCETEELRVKLLQQSCMVIIWRDMTKKCILVTFCKSFKCCIFYFTYVPQSLGNIQIGRHHHNILKIYWPSDHKLQSSSPDIISRHCDANLLSVMSYKNLRSLKKFRQAAQWLHHNTFPFRPRCLMGLM